MQPVHNPRFNGYKIYRKRYRLALDLLNSYDLRRNITVFEIIHHYSNTHNSNYLRQALFVLRMIARATQPVIAHLIEVDNVIGARIMANLWLRGPGTIVALMSGSVSPEYLAQLTFDPVPLIEIEYGLPPDPVYYID